jgi:hypothetical protein
MHIVGSTAPFKNQLVKQPQTFDRRISQTTWSLETKFGEMMNTPRRDYASKITASNFLQLPESQILAKNTMT